MSLLLINFFKGEDKLQNTKRKLFHWTPCSLETHYQPNLAYIETNFPERRKLATVGCPYFSKSLLNTLPKKNVIIYNTKMHF